MQYTDADYYSTLRKVKKTTKDNVYSQLEFLKSINIIDGPAAEFLVLEFENTGRSLDVIIKDFGYIREPQ